MKNALNWVKKLSPFAIGLAVVVFLLSWLGLAKFICLAVLLAASFYLFVTLMTCGDRDTRRVISAVLSVAMLISTIGLFGSETRKAPGKKNTVARVGSGSAVEAVADTSTPYVGYIYDDYDVDLFEDDYSYTSPANTDCYRCHNTKKCPKCNGAKRLSRTRYSIDLGGGSRPYEEYYMCPLCSGTGKCYYCCSIY